MFLKTTLSISYKQNKIIINNWLITTHMSWSPPFHYDMCQANYYYSNDINHTHNKWTARVISEGNKTIPSSLIK